MAVTVLVFIKKDDVSSPHLFVIQNSGVVQTCRWNTQFKVSHMSRTSFTSVEIKLYKVTAGNMIK